MEGYLDEQQTAEFENQIYALDQKIAEFELLRESVEKIQHLKNKEMLVPLGGGVLMKATTAADNKLLINIGANILIYKSFEESATIIDKQILDLIAFQNQLREEMHKLQCHDCTDPEHHH